MATQLAYQFNKHKNSAIVASLENNLTRQNIVEANIYPLKVSRFSDAYLIGSKKYNRPTKTIIRIYLTTRLLLKLCSTHLIAEYDHIIDMEYEPFSFAISSYIKPILLRKTSLVVVHSFPSRSDRTLRGVYKQISVCHLKYLQRSGILIGLMTDESMCDAKKLGFDAEKLVKVGWGFTPALDDINSNDIGSDILSIDFDTEGKMHVLLFGVLRKGKNIIKVISHFQALDNAAIHLIIAGKNIDYNMDYIKRLILEKQSQTGITLIERYLNESEVDYLSRKCQPHAICHCSGFTSASGPLMNAIKHCKNVLCFSEGYIAKTIEELSIGSIAKFDNPSATRDTIIKLAVPMYNSSISSTYTWESIALRILEKISQLSTS